MDIEAPQWDEYEAQFRAIAEQVPQETENKQAVKGAQHYLCLYGDNGLTPEEEFTELAVMRQNLPAVRRVEVDLAYWQDTVLFIP